MNCQTTPIEANKSELNATPPIAANPAPATAAPPTTQSVHVPVESANPTPNSAPAIASKPPLRQPLPFNANKPNPDQPDPSAIPPRHKPVSAGPISTIIARLEPRPRRDLDQAIMERLPGTLADVHEKFDLLPNDPIPNLPLRGFVPQLRPLRFLVLPLHVTPAVRRPRLPPAPVSGRSAAPSP